MGSSALRLRVIGQSPRGVHGWLIIIEEVKMRILDDVSVTDVTGFKAAGIAAGVKKSGKKDMMLLYSEVEAVSAAAFTTNRVKAAPIIVNMENINNSVDVIKENMVELVEVNIFSTIQKTSELPKLHLKINGSVNSYEQGFRAQETGLIALNIDSKLKEIICSIAYLFNLDAKFEDLFSRLISLFTNFKTNEVFPLTPKEQNILEKGEVLRREFSTDINSLSKRPGYKEVYSSLLENLNELCTAVYDELYIPLKEQATQMNDTVSNKIESLDNLFKN